MTKDRLGLYSALSRAPFPKSYPGKVFFSAFLGTHVPLLALIAHLARDPRLGPSDKKRVLAVALAATLGGTAGTLWALHSLLSPVSAASEALRRYLEHREVPDLPTAYPDQAGRLMADVQSSVERLDVALRFLGELATYDHLTDALNRRAGGGERRPRPQRALTVGVSPPRGPPATPCPTAGAPAAPSRDCRYSPRFSRSW